MQPYEIRFFNGTTNLPLKRTPEKLLYIIPWLFYFWNILAYLWIFSLFSVLKDILFELKKFENKFIF